MAKKTQETKEIDFTPLAAMQSVADFYGWKEAIVDEIGKTDTAYAQELGRTNSLLDFFSHKEKILTALKVSE